MTDRGIVGGSATPGEQILRVLRPAPTAVVIVDLASGAVTQANPAGHALVPRQSLPCSAYTWAQAVGMANADETPMAPHDSPPVRVARGETVAGEAVAIRQGDGTPSRLLWAHGWPIAPEHDALGSTGVMVLSDISSLAPRGAGHRLREQAILATERSFSVSGAYADGNPLVYINPAFERLTGYSAEPVIGQNCRFLQGPGTSAAEVAKLRRAIEAGESATVVLLNYRADGTAFWNEVSLSPIVDGTGGVTYFVGVQTDVTARVVAEIERESALAAEKEVRTLLEAVLATAPVGLAFTDLDLRFVQVNRTMAALDGQPAGDHVGRLVTEQFGELGIQMATHLQAVRKTAQPVLNVDITSDSTIASETWRCWLTSYYPVLNGAGNVMSLGAVVTDVTDRRRAERERFELLERERDARRAAEEAGEWLTVLAESMEVLADTLQLEESLQRFAALLVPLLADWCAVDLLDDQGASERLATAATDLSLRRHHVAPAACRRPGSEPGPGAVDPVAAPPAGRTTSPASDIIDVGSLDGSLPGDVLSHGRPVLLSQVTDGRLVQAEGATAPSASADQPAVSVRSIMVLPLRARGRTLGVLTLARTRTEPAYTEDDLALALGLAGRAALAVDNARLYQRERRVAETLQRALLPTKVADIAGVDLCVRYQAAAHDMQVGGDWYDVVPLAGGRVALSIGDVVGHDIAAAVRMGELRTVLRAQTGEGQSPAAAVEGLDRFARTYGGGFVATLLHGILDPSTGAFTYVRAGHLPPVLVRSDGRAEVVDREGEPPLGLGSRRSEQTVVVAPGATLALYTDGLVERRGESIDIGLERLLAVLSDASSPLDVCCDRTLELLAPARTTTDDVALLLARRALASR